MTLVEIGIQNFITRYTFVSPFTIRFTINVQAMAYFWTTTFGCPDESTTERAYILATIANFTDRFSNVNDIDECKNTQESWIFDSDNKALYVNLGVNYNPILDPIEYLKSIGFCNTSVVYVDDVTFLPVISSSPNISQEQDLINYDTLAYSTGSIQLSNEYGELDYIRDMSLFSNDVAISHLDYTGKDEYTRADVTPLSRYLVDDINIGKTKGKITLQDNRKANNVKLPNTLFTTSAYPNAEESVIDTPIPLAFGTLTIPAICTNGTVETGSVTYRAALYLASLGTVQVYYDDTWHTVRPSSSDASTGTFTLSDTNGRGITNKGNWNGATNTPTLSNATGVDGWYYYCTNTGTVDFGAGNVTVEAGEYVIFTNQRWTNSESVGSEYRQARLVSCSGYTATKPSNVIRQLEVLGNSIPYTDSFYDISEIDAEEATLEPISMYISEQEEINEIIRRIQEGSSNRFRYEWNADGLRTIRLDNPYRTSYHFVAKEDILENGEMAIYTDKPTIAASIKINYGSDYSSDKRNSVINSSASDTVASNIRERPQIEFDTFLSSRALAESRASLEVSRLGQVRRFCDITLRGKQYLFLRIYDIITVELIDEFRQWIGTWKCQVLKVAPDIVYKNNKVKLLLVEKVADVDDGESLRVTTSGAIRITQAGTDNLRVTK